MNAGNHIFINKTLYQFLKSNLNINLNKFAFIVGGVLPDYRIGKRSLPHGKKFSWDVISSRISDLPTNIIKYDKISFNNSLKLGEIIHFLSDYFCFEHNTDNGETAPKLTSKHMSYEKGLKAEFKKFDFYKAICSINEKYPNYENVSFPDIVDIFHIRYLDNYKDMSTDILYTFSITLYFLVSVLNISLDDLSSK